MLVTLLKCPLLRCENQERITLGGEVEVLGKWTLCKETCIVFHFQQVVLTISMLEFNVNTSLSTFLLLLFINMQEMLSPSQNAFNDVQGYNSQMCKKFCNLFYVLFNIIYISLRLFFYCIRDHVDLIQTCFSRDYASYCTLKEIIY